VGNNVAVGRGWYSRKIKLKESKSEGHIALGGGGEVANRVACIQICVKPCFLLL
jgi:hypothetical protein